MKSSSFSFTNCFGESGREPLKRSSGPSSTDRRRPTEDYPANVSPSATEVSQPTSTQSGTAQRRRRVSGDGFGRVSKRYRSGRDRLRSPLRTVEKDRRMSSPPPVTRRQFGLGVTGLPLLLVSGCLGSLTGDGDHGESFRIGGDGRYSVSSAVAMDSSSAFRKGRSALSGSSSSRTPVFQRIPARICGLDGRPFAPMS